MTLPIDGLRLVAIRLQLLRIVEHFRRRRRHQLVDVDLDVESRVRRALDHPTHVVGEFGIGDHRLQRRLEWAVRIRGQQVLIDRDVEERRLIEVDVLATDKLRRADPALVRPEQHLHCRDCLELQRQSRLVEHELHAHRAVAEHVAAERFGERLERRDVGEPLGVVGDHVHALRDLVRQARRIRVEGAVRVARLHRPALGDAEAQVRARRRRQVRRRDHEVAQRCRRRGAAAQVEDVRAG
jgi:hypothetical protein